MNKEAVILIYSRNRPVLLNRLLNDLHKYFIPAIQAGGLVCRVCVYAQGYDRGFVSDMVSQFPDDLIFTSDEQQTTIGAVAKYAYETADIILQDQGFGAFADKELAILIDDDSIMYPDTRTAENLRQITEIWQAKQHACYSIKLGPSYSLHYVPFITESLPLMPFREKMIWVRPKHLATAVAHPDFEKLTIGEEVAICATAWKAAASACFGIYGIASFLHLSMDGHMTLEFRDGELRQGGYSELIGDHTESDLGGNDQGRYETGLAGFTVHNLFPNLFVPKGHIYHDYNGVALSAIRSANSGQGASEDINHGFDFPHY